MRGKGRAAARCGHVTQASSARQVAPAASAAAHYLQHSTNDAAGCAALSRCAEACYAGWQGQSDLRLLLQAAAAANASPLVEPTGQLGRAVCCAKGCWVTGG